MSSPRPFFLLLFASLAVSFAGYLFYSRFWLPKEGAAANLAVNSLFEPLTVTLDEETLGQTPFEKPRLKEGERTLTLADNRFSYRTKISLLKGTLTVVNWGLGPTENFSEGEVLWFERSQRKGTAPLLILSDPEGAEARIDGVWLGITPLASNDLSAGEHILNLSKEGFKPREIPINLQESYRLKVKVKLFPLPVTSTQPIRLEYPAESRFWLYDLTTENSSLLADPYAWAKGLNFYLSGGKEATEGGLPYDHLLDFRGQIYDWRGVKVAAGSEAEQKKEKVKIGYLGRRGEGLTEEAKKTLADFAPMIFPSLKKVEILATPYGWLRLREKPSLASKEIGRVNSRDQLELIEEAEGGWYKVRTAEGKVGYIAASYAKKL